MLRLTNTTSDLISLITAQNGAKVFACYNDRTATAYGPGANQPTTISSATTTTIVSTPAASTAREVDYMNIKNTFAGSHLMTVQASISGTLYPRKTFTLLENESIEYTHAEGFVAMDANGNRKEAIAGTVILNSGTYTPTLTAVANVAILTTYDLQYSRTGDTVVVSGQMDIDPTVTLTNTRIGISLPIPSNFTATNECGGTGAAEDAAGECMAIKADATNNRAEMRWICINTAASATYFIFSYTIIP